MQGSQMPCVIVLSSSAQDQLLTPSKDLHQAHTRYALVTVDSSIPIFAPGDTHPHRFFRRRSSPRSLVANAGEFQYRASEDLQQRWPRPDTSW
jgi:hypothetical protein